MTTTVLYTIYAILAVGAAGVYLCLPSARRDARRLRIAGGIVAAAALVGMATFWTRWIGPGFDGRVYFVIFAVISVVAAVRMITHDRPVYSALYFVLVVLAVTGLCFLAAAEFLGAAMVIVYGGAILVTYVFVIMLAQQSDVPTYDRQAKEPFAAVVMGLLLLAATTQAMTGTDRIAAHAAGVRSSRLALFHRGDGVARAVADGEWTDAKAITTAKLQAISGEAGNTRAIGATLMTTYVIAVEVAGLLLLVAMVGALCIARKQIEAGDLTASERKRQVEDKDLRRRGREAAPF